LSDAVSLLTAKSDNPVRSIVVKGETFYVRQWRLTERLEYLGRLGKDAKLTPSAAAWALVLSVCNEVGELLMTPDHVPQIMASESDYFPAVVGFIFEVNGLLKDSVDDAIKNSETGPNSDSPLDSATISESPASPNSPPVAQ
jgi:hypothetical protein